MGNQWEGWKGQKEKTKQTKHKNKHNKNKRQTNNNETRPRRKINEEHKWREQKKKRTGNTKGIYEEKMREESSNYLQTKDSYALGGGAGGEGEWGCIRIWNPTKQYDRKTQGVGTYCVLVIGDTQNIASGISTWQAAKYIDLFRVRSLTSRSNFGLVELSARGRMPHLRVSIPLAG